MESQRSAPCGRADEEVRRASSARESSLALLSARANILLSTSLRQHTASVRSSSAPPRLARSVQPCCRSSALRHFPSHTTDRRARLTGQQHCQLTTVLLAGVERSCERSATDAVKANIVTAQPQTGGASRKRTAGDVMQGWTRQQQRSVVSFRPPICPTLSYTTVAPPSTLTS